MIVKLYPKFNDADRNSTDITNPTHQSPHAPISTSLTRKFCEIILHQSQYGSQHSANCDRYAEADNKEKDGEEKEGKGGKGEGGGLEYGKGKGLRRVQGKGEVRDFQGQC